MKGFPSSLLCIICLVLIIYSPILAKSENIDSASDVNTTPSAELLEISNRETKVSNCSVAYIKKQTGSYTKMAQANLYDLMHNFDRVISRIYSNSNIPDIIPYAEKIEVLARVQCETYYDMGVLK